MNNLFQEKFSFFLTEAGDIALVCLQDQNEEYHKSLIRQEAITRSFEHFINGEDLSKENLCTLLTEYMNLNTYLSAKQSLALYSQGYRDCFQLMRWINAFE